MTVKPSISPATARRLRALARGLEADPATLDLKRDKHQPEESSMSMSPPIHIQHSQIAAAMASFQMGCAREVAQHLRDGRISYEQAKDILLDLALPINGTCKALTPTVLTRKTLDHYMAIERIRRDAMDQMMALQTELRDLFFKRGGA